MRQQLHCHGENVAAEMGIYSWPWAGTRAAIGDGRCLLTYGVGAEWQQWSGAAIAGDASNEANLYDAGWAGFVFRAGLKF